MTETQQSETIQKLWVGQYATLDYYRALLKVESEYARDLAPSVLKELGLWNPEILRKQVEGYYQPFDGTETEDDRLYHQQEVAKEILEEEAELEKTGLKIGHSLYNLILANIDKNSELAGFSSEGQLAKWKTSDTPRAETQINPDVVITPKIITIVVDTYDFVFKRVAEEYKLPPCEFPGFEYTYVAPGAGFTLKELMLHVKESVRKYLYIAQTMWRKAYYALDNIECNKIIFQDGKYYVKTAALCT